MQDAIDLKMMSYKQWIGSKFENLEKGGFIKLYT
jgi:hypothetical protein